MLGGLLENIAGRLRTLRGATSMNRKYDLITVLEGLELSTN